MAIRKLRRTAAHAVAQCATDGDVNCRRSGTHQESAPWTWPQTEEECITIRHIIHGFFLASLGIHHPQQNAEYQQHGYRNPQVAQRGFDDVLQSETEDNNRIEPTIMFQPSVA